ncbi:TPR repeat [bacterium A37T11]|nr:TPR repeat [bacterium A37T11]
MSHRIYLYNFKQKERIHPEIHPIEKDFSNPLDLLSNIGYIDDETLLVVEWNYELPVFFYPLLAGHPFLGSTLYNDPQGGIFASAEEGRNLFRVWYNFLERHADVLVNNVDAFRKVKEKLVNFLEEEIVHPYMHLDASDVFNMQDESHAAQGATLLQEINETNNLIKKAINEDDPAVLDNLRIIKHPIYGYSTFKHLLNDSTYGYGLKAIMHEEDEKDEEDEINTVPVEFEIVNRDGLFGLLDKMGNEILPVMYTRIYPVGSRVFEVHEGINRGLYMAGFGFLAKPCQDIFEMNEKFAVYAFKQHYKWGICSTNKGMVSKPVWNSLVSHLDYIKEGDWRCLVFSEQNCLFVFADTSTRKLSPEECLHFLGEEWEYALEEEQKIILLKQAGEIVPPILLQKFGSYLLDAGRIAKAYPLLEKAGKKGNADALFELGCIHIDCEGFIDHVKGYNLLTQAAAAGSSSALNALGVCFQFGYGVKPDNKKAMHYYNEGASLGVPDAYLNLGKIYVEGELAAYDLDKAYTYLKRAEAENEYAYDYLGFVHEKRLEYDDALFYYKIGQQAGSGYCANCLAAMYEEGLGCRADTRKALSMYEKAWKLGYTQAVNEIIRIYRYDEELKNESKAQDWEQKKYS